MTTYDTKNQSDKTLLELAAKAAGIEGNYVGGMFSGIVGAGINDIDVPWNPLRNDGQALRLAVKLEILVDIYDKYSDATDGKYADICEMHNGDPYAATRRAIVRAAAIGEKL